MTLPSPPPPRRAQARYALALLLAVAAAATPLRAQSVPVYGRPEKHDWISFDYLHGSADLNAYYEDNTSTANGSKTHTSDLRLEETLSLRTHGAIYHPNLINFDLAGTFGPSEEFTSGSGGFGNQTGTSLALVDDYNLNATILRNSFAPVTLYTRRAESYVNQPFAGTLRDITTEYGGNVEFHSSALPSWLRAFHSETEQRDLTGLQSFNLSQDNIQWHSEAHPTDRQAITFDYQYESDSQTSDTLSQSAFTSQEATLTHTWDLDANRRYNLTSLLNVSTREGDFSRQHLNWDESLRLQHTDTFETHYRYDLNQETTNDSDQTSHQATAGFTHRLFKSLVTTGNLGYHRIDLSPSGGSQEARADLNFAYTKKVPLGQFSADLGFGYAQQQNEATSTPTSVFNQPFTFPAAMPLTINTVSQKVDPNSIVLTNATGLRTYTPGIDYTVTTFPNRIEINRIIGGALFADPNVLADYTILPQPANNSSTATFNCGARYEFQEGWFKGLGFYGRYFRQDQSIASENAGMILPENVSDTIFGADYRIWHVTFNVEEEQHQSTITPFNAFRFTAVYLERLSRATSFNLTGTYNVTDYPSENNRDVLTSLSAGLGYEITRNLEASAALLWRDEQNQIFGNNQGVDVQAELRWKYRQTQLFLRIRDTLINNTGPSSGSQEQGTLFFQMGLRREF